MNINNIIEEANKVKEEINRINKETEDMLKDIDDYYEIELEKFKEAIKPIRDVFYSDGEVFRNRRFLMDTGILFNGYELQIGFDKENGTRNPIVDLPNGYSTLANLEYIKQTGNYEIVKMLINNKELAISTMEKSFVEQYSGEINKRFLEVAKKNDEARNEWNKIFVSNKPFYTEVWTDHDVIKALEKAGKPTTKSNINAVKQTFLEDYVKTNYQITSHFEILTDIANEL